MYSGSNRSAHTSRERRLGGLTLVVQSLSRTFSEESLSFSFVSWPWVWEFKPPQLLSQRSTRRQKNQQDHFLVIHRKTGTARYGAQLRLRKEKEIHWLLQPGQVKSAQAEPVQPGSHWHRLVPTHTPFWQGRSQTIVAGSE